MPQCGNNWGRSPVTGLTPAVGLPIQATPSRHRSAGPEPLATAAQSISPHARSSHGGLHLFAVFCVFYCGRLSSMVLDEEMRGALVTRLPVAIPGNKLHMQMRARVGGVDSSRQHCHTHRRIVMHANFGIFARLCSAGTVELPGRHAEGAAVRRRRAVTDAVGSLHAARCWPRGDRQARRPATLAWIPREVPFQAGRLTAPPVSFHQQVLPHSTVGASRVHGEEGRDA